MKCVVVGIRLSYRISTPLIGGSPVGYQQSGSTRGPILMAVKKDWVYEALSRTCEQEARYGYNTGHFTLRVEKENTLIGTLGEIVAREALTSVLKRRFASTEVVLSETGASVDLVIKGVKQLQGVHVKTGLWRNCPRITLRSVFIRIRAFKRGPTLLCSPHC